MAHHHRTVAVALFVVAAAAHATTQGVVFDEMHARSFPLEAANAGAIAAADFDLDGDVDLIVARSAPFPGGSIEFLANDGRGRYANESWRVPVVAGAVVRFAVGDVDGDGDPDCVAGLDRGKDRLLRNDGTGVLTDDTTGNLDIDGAATNDVALADLDGDSDLDLLIGSSWTVSAFSRIALNDGTGRFTDAPNPRLPDFATELTPFDADRDGDTDLLLYAVPAGSSRRSVMLLLNGGNATFTVAPAAQLPPVTPVFGRIRTSDVDGDGDPDVVIGARNYGGAGGEGVVLWINDGQGGFTDRTAQQIPAIADNVVELVPTDLDGDGDIDLVAIAAPPALRSDLGRDRVLINDGTGTFSDRTVQLSFEDAGIAGGPGVTADFDGDGDADLLLGDPRGAARYYLNAGGGRLRVENPRSIPDESDPDQVVVAGDVDGDGDLDILTLGPPFARLLRNDGFGRFLDDTEGNLPYQGSFVDAAMLVDVDGDRDVDLVTSLDRLYLNDGSGSFAAAPPGQMPPTGVQATADIAVGDVDADGDPDLVLAKRGERKRLLRNDGAGNFTDDTTAAFGPQLSLDNHAVSLGDLDGDGDLDAVFGLYDPSTKTGGRLEILFNDGYGTFRRDQRSIQGVVRNTTDVVLADFDGDGDLDVFQAALAWCANPAPDDCRLYLNNGVGILTDVTATHLPSIAQETTRATAEDVDADGDLDIVIANAAALLGCGGIDPQDRVLLNDGTGRFVDSTGFFLPSERDFGSDLAFGDFDSDGDPDLLVANVPYGSTSEFAHDRLLTNRFVQLDSPELVQSGAALVLDFHAVRYPQPTGVVALPILSVAELRVPLGSLGVLRVDPTQGLFAQPVALTGSGFASVRYPLPMSTSLVGRELFSQAILIVGPNPADWRLSNALRDVVQ